jgi:hypothetical protein
MFIPAFVLLALVALLQRARVGRETPLKEGATA